MLAEIVIDFGIPKEVNSEKFLVDLKFLIVRLINDKWNFIFGNNFF